MGNLYKLLNGQTIHIDAHNHGGGEISNFNDDSQDVHIHKTFRRNEFTKKGHIDIRIPLKESGKLFISPNAPDYIKREIQNILGSKKNRNDFLEKVYKELQDNWKWDNNETNRRKIAEKIASVFDLKLTPCMYTQYLSANRIQCIYIMTREEHSRYDKIYRFIADSKEGFLIGETTSKYALYTGGIEINKVR